MHNLDLLITKIQNTTSYYQKLRFDAAVPMILRDFHYDGKIFKKFIEKDWQTFLSKTSNDGANQLIEKYCFLILIHKNKFNFFLWNLLNESNKISVSYYILKNSQKKILDFFINNVNILEIKNEYHLYGKLNIIECAILLLLKSTKITQEKYLNLYNKVSHLNIYINYSYLSSIINYKEIYCTNLNFIDCTKIVVEVDIGKSKHIVNIKDACMWDDFTKFSETLLQSGAHYDIYHNKTIYLKNENEINFLLQFYLSNNFIKMHIIQFLDNKRKKAHTTSSFNFWSFLKIQANQLILNEKITNKEDTVKSIIIKI